MSPRYKRHSIAWLIVVGLTTTFCTLLANRTAAWAFPGLHWVGPSCVGAALLALSIYIAIRPDHPFGGWFNHTDWSRVTKLSLWWLAAWAAGSVTYGALRGPWLPYVTGTAAVLGFLVFGPIAEELLFRGAVFELAQRAFPHETAAPILISTALFSAYHLQIHSYQITPLVLAQLAFTLPLGYVLAKLRAWTGSLWPGLLLHVITNVPYAIVPHPGEP